MSSCNTTKSISWRLHCCYMVVYRRPTRIHC